MIERKLLKRIARIYRAARDSEDGERCMIGPSPELRERIKTAIAAMRANSGLPQALSLRAAEPRVLGFNDGVIYPPHEFAPGTSPSIIRSAAARITGPLRGVVRVIVVLVDFSDKHMSQTQQHYEDLFFALGKPKKSVREYYRDVTHGLIDLQGVVAGPFRLPQTLKSYAHGASGQGTAPPNAQTMASDAVSAADPQVDFTPYDNDGDGFVDAFVVIHAGPGAEVTGSNDDIWSHKWVLAGGARAVDRTKIYGYLTVPEDCEIGVCAHELGHLLFGFPDLYDTDGSSEGIGKWCLMAAGSWGSGAGDDPVHPSAWCKANQGWATVNVVQTDGAITVTEVKTSSTVHRLWMNAMGGNEYFLIENRQQIGFDASLPAGGLLIWHIDDGQPTNRDENHYKVALMQADGKRELEHNVNRGDAGDPYPGSSNNRTFNATSNPSSKSYANADSLVAVTSISASGPAMTMQVQVKLQSGSVLTAFSQAGGPNLYRVHWSADGTQLGSSWPLYEGATRVVAMIPYQDGVLTAFANSNVHWSPDGFNLGSGPSRSPGTTPIVAMIPYRDRALNIDGVLTAFANGNVHWSPDGYNLGSGPSRSPGTTPIVAMTPYQHGVLTAFANSNVHWSPDGYNLGSGPSRSPGTTPIVTMIPYRDRALNIDGVLTAFANGNVHWSPDGYNLGSGPSRSPGTTPIVAMLPYQHGVLTAFANNKVHWSPNGYNLGSGPPRYEGSSPVTAMAVFRPPNQFDWWRRDGNGACDGAGH